MAPEQLQPNSAAAVMADAVPADATRCHIARQCALQVKTGKLSVAALPLPLPS